MSKQRVDIYTDGACSPNPGTGGWGAILIASQHDHIREISGAERETTNNRMELTAAIEALRALKKPCEAHIHTDSQYLKNAFTQKWLDKWQRNGWVSASKKPVLNQDLWRELLRLAETHEIHWLWVRGHQGDEMNERCDELAVQARIKLAGGA